MKAPLIEKAQRPSDDTENTEIIVKAEEKVDEKPAEKVDEKPAEKVDEPKFRLAFMDTNPSNWSLHYEGSVLIGRNAFSNETFEGTMEEFNKALRG